LAIDVAEWSASLSGISLSVKEPFWKPVDYGICFKDLAKTNVSIARNRTEII
jgi:hypothetical protein